MYPLQFDPIFQYKPWDPEYAKRKQIKAPADKLIPEFSIRMERAASIDVTQPEIDKASGIGELRDVLSIALKEMMFFGDAMFPGGNDYPPEQAEVFSVCVRGPHEMKRVIEAVIGCMA